MKGISPWKAGVGKSRLTDVIGRHCLLLCLFAVVLALAPSKAKALQSASVTYYLTDPQGTVLATMDEQGEVIDRFDYKPYGAAAGQQTDSHGPGYAGHVTDSATTFSYMQARYDDVEVGRFLSVDPMRLSPGDLFGMNRYAYGSNNPISNVDPDGMDDCSTSDTGPESSGTKPCVAPTQPGPLPSDAVALPIVRVSAPITSTPTTLPRGIAFPVPLIVAQAAVAGLFFVDSNRFNELVFNQHSCYGSISCGQSRPAAVFSMPPGVWPADKGAEEWGRRNGVGRDGGRRRFHDIKGDDTAHSGGKAEWGVNPESGDVYDPEGEVHGNLAD